MPRRWDIVALLDYLAGDLVPQWLAGGGLRPLTMCWSEPQMFVETILARELRSTFPGPLSQGGCPGLGHLLVLIHGPAAYAHGPYKLTVTLERDTPAEDHDTSLVGGVDAK